MSAQLPSQLFRRFARGAALALLVLAPTTGCSKNREPATVPIEDLPPYTQEQAQVFNDELAPEVFDVPLERQEYAASPDFGRLVREADLITRARLVTLTRANTSGEVRYVLVLETVGSPILGAPLSDTLAPDGRLEVSVGLASPSLGLLRSRDMEAVGNKFIVFLKRYRVKDQGAWHFRGEPDSARVLEAIERARD